MVRGRAPYLCLLSFLVALVIIQEIQGIEYVIINNAGGTKGSILFETKLRKDAATVMASATKYIWKLLGQSQSSDDRVKVVQIYLVLEEMLQDSLYQFNYQIGKIYISTDYIKKTDKKELGSDFLDLMYYEMTHILQWGANGDPLALAMKNGIAAYAVLHSRDGPRGWVKFGGGNAWYESPNVTGRFFHYVSNHICPELVPRLNAKMKYSCDDYDQYFFEVTRKTITEAWKQYKDKYTKQF